MIHALSPLAGSTAVPLGAAAGGVSEGGSSKAAATGGGGGAAAAVVPLGLSSGELVGLRLRQVLEPLKPQWHAPWKLQRVISGHLGWVNCVSVDPTNNFFATGSNDRLLKIWDLATGQLKLSLTGHVSSLRDIQISDRHPYLFSCGEDGRVKCWDLEQNRVVRDYHGHLSGVYTLALHPSLDILCSGGRDAVVRVWDMRTKQSIYTLAGHTGTIMKVQMQTLMPHIVSGSQDKMVRLWDLSAGKCQATLTNHKKSVRSLAIHPTEYSFVTCGADRVKVWRSPLGVFERNVEGLNAIPNCCAIRSEGDKSSLVVGSNNGQLHFWDWKSGYKYQTLQSRVQPGSLESENGIFCCTFDRSETRLITGECDKTIKIWKMDEDATEETHPISWRHGRDARKALAF
ncbi:wd g-beta repeat-containing protein [Cyclospora cayetanensis]|uniref:Wd g-beta repeat-containing protein n=1 Tax=Cyclospora cayetanensis TaxID=88456 RepID=A0A1D3CVD7_9EIME|nr:wd g-beta repeat-containing protein [Cyclospora cayetanensis]